MNIIDKIYERKNNQTFTLIRKPKEKSGFLIIDEEGKNTYSFTSFDLKKKYNLNFNNSYEFDIDDYLDKKINITLPEYSKQENETNETDYINLLNKTIDTLKKGGIKKIVISRKISINYNNVNLLKSWINLCKSFPDSFCYLSYWNENEIWIGATPEILGIFNGNQFKTMSLAGTLPIEDEFNWTDKEIEEQKFVTNYIIEKLNPYLSELNIDGPHNLPIGNIKHLVSYISGKEIDIKNQEDIISKLHPTPAVCGAPLEESKTFILENENYERDFYSGYISLKENDINNNSYFVNLRCAKVFNSKIIVYVGGGITAQSIAESEKNETFMKSKFIINNLSDY